MPTQQTIAISFLLLYGNRSVPNSLFQRGLFGQSIALVLKPCMQHAKTTNTKTNHLRETVTRVCLTAFTTQHKTVLIVFSLIFQTVIEAHMMFTAIQLLLFILHFTVYTLCSCRLGFILQQFPVKP